MDWIGLYLEEDLDGAGDITSDSIFPAQAHGTARLVARERGFLAGVGHAVEVFSRCGATSTTHMNDGSWVLPGGVVLTVAGPVRAILAAERTALNLLGRMTGIATRTRTLMDALADAGSTARVAGTRKTTPGFRVFEKEAIAIGGGDPHRMGLYDQAMIKDNHRVAAGDLAHAIRAVREAHPDAVRTVEVESLDDARTAAKAGAHWILIDNQDPATGRAWAEAVRAEHPGIRIEASGGITFETVPEYHWADRISLGALTHHAVSVDFSLDWDDPGTGGEARS